MRTALLLVDVQYDFLPPTGALAVPRGDDILPVVHRLVDEGNWDLMVASQDFHPPGHISFATTHSLPPFTTTLVPDPRTGRQDKEQELWPDHCVQGTPGCELEAGLRQRLERRARDRGTRYEVVQKGADVSLDAYSSFASPLAHPASAPSPLTQLLLEARIDTLVVAGLATDFCVRHSVLDALRLPWSSSPPTTPNPGSGRVLVVRDGVRGVDPHQSDEVLQELEQLGARVISVEEALRIGSESSSSSSLSSPQE